MKYLDLRSLKKLNKSLDRGAKELEKREES